MFSVVQTVMFLLLFRYVFGGSIEIPAMSFVDFLIPGYLAQIAIFDGFGVSDLDGRGLEVGPHRPVPRAADGAVGGGRRAARSPTCSGRPRC